MDKTGNHDGMKYIGDGTCLPGVPARDLTAEEIAELAYSRADLLQSGLYVLAGQRKAYTPKPSKSAWKGDNADTQEE